MCTQKRSLPLPTTRHTQKKWPNSLKEKSGNKGNIIGKSICRDCILYPLQLGPPFPNDVGILKPKVGLRPDQIEIDLRKEFSEKI